MTRILDLDRDALAALHGRELTTAVAEAEGRTIVAEVIAGASGLADGVHNMEVLAALGADLVILNFVEGVLSDQGWSFPELGPVADLRVLARAIGRPVGVNLEPGDAPPPRRATAEAAKRVLDDGAAMLCLTANPSMGTGYEDLRRATATLREALGTDVALWAGKMHEAGRSERIGPEAIVRCAAAHDAGAIVMGTIGTSQEGSRPDIAPTLALLAKEIGVDAHHIGDAGLSRSGDPDLLYEYSIAVRGRRHTWRRMAFGNRRR